jgi:hypothetical protein
VKKSTSREENEERRGRQLSPGRKEEQRSKRKKRKDVWMMTGKGAGTRLILVLASPSQRAGRSIVQVMGTALTRRGADRQGHEAEAGRG